LYCKRIPYTCQLVSSVCVLVYFVFILVTFFSTFYHYCGIEACPVNKSVIKSLEFVVNNAFRKIFATKSCDIANECVLMVNCSVYDMVHKKSKFLNKLEYNENTLCKMFQNNIQVELSALYCT